ncbi:AraC family transcriptional regulator [Aldersonia sp. NBC_00410]|uniref:AraC family transcriptional regulator n=1 Tax=Aldersonia sp. NBC_00410 TaxID=2975954 RepID=UPI00225431F7|nr:AraC family transcriptional regulator [Aldersonia sp. NBC_00410]MCX5042069.1 AraC family transcriptional regulator [Aldersonia sp. NBC_00410]
MKPLVRYASIAGYLDLVRSMGEDPDPLMRYVGLDPAGPSSADRWIPAIAVTRLLEITAAVTEHPDFALRLVERRRFADLGPVSLVIREEPDIRSAVQFLIRYQHMYNEALRIRVVEDTRAEPAERPLHNLASIRLGIELGEPGDTRQATELAVGVLHRLLRDLVGAAWQPLAVSFTHRAPADATTHQRVFGTTVRFDQEFSGVVLSTDQLDSPNVTSAPEFAPYVQRYLDSLNARDEATTVRRVRELVELLLPTGRCSVDQVARSMGVDRRTVHRHLAAHGETFSSVLNTTRVELAEHMVTGRRYSLTDVAALLGFSTAGNFSRWFREQFGRSPRQWRNTPTQEVAQGVGAIPATAPRDW